MRVTALDHFVITVRDLDAACRFYVDVLGMERREFNGRTALHFGTQKINVHVAGSEFSPHATHPVPGAADLCFLTAAPAEETLAHLAAHGVAVELGPVTREGARGSMTSVYVRDPDGNLIEVAVYDR